MSSVQTVARGAHALDLMKSKPRGTVFKVVCKAMSIRIRLGFVLTHKSTFGERLRRRVLSEVLGRRLLKRGRFEIQIAGRSAAPIHARCACSLTKSIT